MFAAMTISRTLTRPLAPTLLGAALVALSALTPAHASEDLARQKACLACHQVNKAVVGPSFVDIAKKYKGNKKAVEQLAAKVRKGGGGVWNMPMGPMPAQGQVSEAEAKQLVTWILATK
jgi:cytochrome c